MIKKRFFFVYLVCSMFFLMMTCNQEIDKQQFIDKFSRLTGEWQDKNLIHRFFANGSGKLKYISKSDNINVNVELTIDTVEEVKGMVVIENRPYMIFSMSINDKKHYFGFHQEKFILFWNEKVIPEWLVIIKGDFDSISDISESTPEMYVLGRTPAKTCE